MGKDKNWNDNDFCFIVISYNQEDYVFEHLESIKYLIEKYGGKKRIQLIFSDDCSKDATVEKAKYWIEQNRDLFNEYNIIEHKNNVGTIRNMIDAKNYVKSSLYKELACDDLYYKNNIFDLCLDNKIVITPTIHFFDPNIVANKPLSDYLLFVYNKDKNIKSKLKNMLDYNQCIPSPGVILPLTVWKDDDFKDFLLKYKYIEDIPEWYYLFNINDFNLEIDIYEKPIVLYRRNVGVSNRIKKKHNPIDDEYKRMRKDIVSKQDYLPKYLNPYAFIHFIKTRILIPLYKNTMVVKNFLEVWDCNVKDAESFIEYIQRNAKKMEASYVNFKNNIE